MFQIRESEYTVMCDEVKGPPWAEFDDDTYRVDIGRPRSTRPGQALPFVGTK